MCRLFLQVSKGNDSATSCLIAKENSLLAQSISDASNRPNADGWGIAWINNTSEIRMLKSPDPAFLDPNFKHTASRVKSQVILAHIRRGSIGPVHYNNTHPFMCENWSFIQNGNIPFLKNNRNLIFDEIATEYRHHIKGSTDSEFFFYFILSKIKGISFDQSEKILKELSSVVAQIKLKIGDLTHKKALNFIMINPSFQVGYRLNRELYYCSVNNKIIVASEPIYCYNKWREIAEDSFFIIKDGTIKLFPDCKKLQPESERMN